MFYKIDFKSFLIGVLSLSCILMFMGYGTKNDAHFDTIYANEIVLHTSDYSQFLYPSGSILYDKGTNMSILTSAFGISAKYDFQGVNERLVFDMYVDDSTEGRFYTYNQNGNKLIALTKDIDGNGIIQVNDKYGEAGAQLIGSGKTWTKY